MEVPHISELSPVLEGNSAIAKRLGGSTGAYLFRARDGRPWVVKLGGKVRWKNGWAANAASSGAGKFQILAEAAALDIYSALDILVPAHRLDRIMFQDEEYPVLINEYIDAPLLGTVSKKRFAEAVRELQAHYAADVLLANIDVLGSKRGYDNILVSEKGSVRIDNGSSFEFSGTGKPKAFDARVDVESIKRHQMVVFGGLQTEEIVKQIHDLAARVNRVLAVTPDRYKKLVGERMESMVRWAEEKENEKAKAKAKAKANTKTKKQKHTK
jgi:hypothetical protein